MIYVMPGSTKPIRLLKKELYFKLWEFMLLIEYQYYSLYDNLY